MAKNCDCDFLIETVATHTGMLGLPLETRMVWQLLVRHMLRLSQSGLTVGSEVMNLAGIAGLIPISQAELETHLEPLIRRNFLAWRADGALECPQLAQRLRRAENSRINGMKGGRPRKQVDGQGSFMLPLAGGRTGNEKTQAETPSRAALASLEAREEKQLATALAADSALQEVVPLAGELADAAGIPTKITLSDCKQVQLWMRRGMTIEQLRTVFAEVTGRKNYETPRLLAYFDAAVREFGRTGYVQPGQQVADTSPEIQAFLEAAKAWQEGGCFGEPPKHPREVAA